jgi:thiol-disulfide isomerase/thioredoxin/DNA-directed RNA polymerase subunit F
MKMKKNIILLTVLCGVLLTGCGRKDDVVTPGELGDAAAPLIGLKWIKGDPVTIQPGHVYVVEFWATWCPPCRASIPHLTKLQAEYKDKVTIIGVSVDKKSVRKVRKFVKKQGETMEYTVAYEKKGKVKKAYSRAFGRSGIPHAFIVDQQGAITWVGHPMAMDDVLKKVVDGTFDAAAYAEQKKQAQLNAAKLQKWLGEYFTKIESASSEETRKIADQIIEIADPGLLNEFAWKILDEVKEENRDLDVALKAAKKANDMTEGKSFAVLDTYALALFKSGKVQDAIVQQQKAVELSAGDPQMQKRLEEFKAALTRVSSPN